MEIYKRGVGCDPITTLELNRDELILIEYLLEKNSQKVSGKVENSLSSQLYEKIKNYSDKYSDDDIF